MMMSVEGRRQLTQREGTRLRAYKDSKGIWTIGVGHTSVAGPPKVTPDLVITIQESDAIFNRDLVQYETAVNKAVKIPLRQNEFDALVSLCYNIGPTGLARSSVVKYLNAGDRQGAANAFMQWVKPPEITGRRLTEKKQFLTPYADAGNAAVIVGGGAVVGTATYFWHDPLFWPVIGGVVLTAGIITLIVHNYRNRKKITNV